MRLDDDPAYRHFRLIDAAPWWVLALFVVLAVVCGWAFHGCVTGG
jgi:type VI protein secretion system component VasF